MNHLTRKTIVVASIFITEFAAANSGALQKCEPISTANGYKYVGVYCVDYECKYVVRKIFNEYCPYLLPNE